MPAPQPQAPRSRARLCSQDGQHDAMVEDVIIFSGEHGVRSANGANRLQGIHAWNLAGSSGGKGIELGVKWNGASGGRVQNCYLDYAPLVITNPGNLLVSGNLFLGSSAIVLAARGANFALRNVIIKDNGPRDSHPRPVRARPMCGFGSLLRQSTTRAIRATRASSSTSEKAPSSR